MDLVTGTPKIGSNLIGALKRRALLAGTATLLAVGLEKMSVRVAAAANGDPLVLGTGNTATSTTSLSTSSADSALQVSNSSGEGIRGQGSGAAHGVVGVSANGNGLNGTSTGAAGVAGNSTLSPGVYGNSTSSYGVLGTSANAPALSGSSTNAVGVYGNSAASYGVLGTSSAVAGLAGDAPAAFGVYGNSGSNAGVYGQSQSAAGVSGYSATGRGVQGISGGSGAGVYGHSSGGGLAGQFDGPVVVNGSFSATGIKSAVVPHPDGMSRRVYCQESPEAWFEDFGESRLVDGYAEVQLDRDFAALVRLESYQVFLTEYGDHKALYVDRRTPAGFSVRSKSGANFADFGYRVVALRGDIQSVRLERVELPQPSSPERAPIAERAPLEHARAAEFPSLPE